MSKENLEWDAEALQRLNKAPFLVRKMARAKVEKAARAKGETRITVDLLERVKNKEMG